VNNVNQITGQSAGGPTRFQGSVSEPSRVTVNGQPATMTTSTKFVANPVLPSGTGTVTVVATDGSGNAQTNNYQVVIPPGSAVTPVYDSAGNMTDNGRGQTCQWDAENRLIQISLSSNTYAFTYDGMGRRVSETDNGTLAKQWVWSGATMVEERDSSNAVTKRFYPQGEQIGGTAYFYKRDHLGSVREMTDSSGTIQARYEYDPYGRVTKVSGGMDSDFQYAGYYAHIPTGLNMTRFRAYDPNTGRWLSRDPIAEKGGINLYDYVGNDPINLNDPLGLWQVTLSFGFELMGQITFGSNDGRWNGGFGIGVGEGFSVEVNPEDEDPNAPENTPCNAAPASFRFKASGGIGGGGGVADAEASVGFKGSLDQLDWFAAGGAGVGIGAPDGGATVGVEGESGYHQEREVDPFAVNHPFHTEGKISKSNHRENLFFGESVYAGANVGFSSKKCH